MVKSHMNLMDTLMDEFHDEQKFKELNEREVAAWLEVSYSLRMRSLRHLDSPMSYEFSYWMVAVLQPHSWQMEKINTNCLGSQEF